MKQTKNCFKGYGYRHDMSKLTPQAIRPKRNPMVLWDVGGLDGYPKSPIGIQSENFVDGYSDLTTTKVLPDSINPHPLKPTK